VMPARKLCLPITKHFVGLLPGLRVLRAPHGSAIWCRAPWGGLRSLRWVARKLGARGEPPFEHNIATFWKVFRF